MTGKQNTKNFPKHVFLCLKASPHDSIRPPAGHSARAELPSPMQELSYQSQIDWVVFLNPSLFPQAFFPNIGSKSRIDPSPAIVLGTGHLQWAKLGKDSSSYGHGKTAAFCFGYISPNMLLPVEAGAGLKDPPAPADPFPPLSHLTPVLCYTRNPHREAVHLLHSCLNPNAIPHPEQQTCTSSATRALL